MASLRSWIPITLWLLAYLVGSGNTSLSPLSGSNVLVGSDPFVTSAPLIIAAVCSDGVALMAIHTAFHEEPLLLDADDDSDDQMDDNNTVSQRNTTTVEIKDIPRSYRGPFRIYSIDSFGTAMVCAGWRSHGQLVADYCRDLAKEELQVYGPPRMTLASCKEYGHYLALETSAWMAYTAVLRKHPWSCVGLLATCSSSTSSCGSESSSEESYNPSGTHNPPGCLWLVDTTGAYRVRAHAVGGGALAGIVNQYLVQRLLLQGSSTEGYPPLPSSEEILRDLLVFLSQQHTILPSGTRAELAVIGPDNSIGKTRLKRVFTSGLFGVKSTAS